MAKATYRSKFFLPSLLLYLSLLVGWTIALWLIADPSWWWFALSPLPLMTQVIVVLAQRYEVRAETLELKILLERKEIPLSQITEVRTFQNSKWRMWLAGFPPTSLLVNYQKYEEALLHPAEPDQLRQLLRSRTEAVST